MFVQITGGLFKMENKKKLGLKTGQLIALAIVLALNLLWIISMVIVMAETGFVSAWNIASIIIWVAAIFYVLYEYKKPHGNLFRYLMLVYACDMAFMLLLNFNNQELYINALYLAKIILSVYMAGRLDRYTQNVIISAVILVCNCIIAYSIINMITGFGMRLTFLNFICYSGSVTVWLAIAASYIIRYKPHKEAGLADK